MLALALVADRARLLVQFGTRYTDEDQALLWFTLRDLAAGHVREPYFYGQRYGSWLESAVGIPFATAGLPLSVALPIASTLAGLAPWILFAWIAWRRRGPVLAVPILAFACVLSLEGTILSSLPRGLLPGVLLGCAAAALGMSRLATAVEPVFALRQLGVAAALGVLSVVAFSLNQGSLLVTAPVIAYTAVERRRQVPWLAGIAGGAVAGLTLHVLAQSFYTVHPGADLHGAPAIAFDPGLLGLNLGFLDRYLAAFAPEMWRSAAVPLVLLSSLCALAVLRFDLPHAAAAIAGVAPVVAILAAPKSVDGFPSIFFPHSRLFLAFPWLVCVLALLAARRDDLDHRTALGAAMAVGLVALAAFMVREAMFNTRLDSILSQAERTAVAKPRRSDEVERTCRRTASVAARLDVHLVVERRERIWAYACGAMYYGSFDTAFPPYERRVWVMGSLDGEPVLVRDIDDGECRRSLSRSVATCTRVDDDLFLVTGYRGPLADLLGQFVA